jgi:hypothetical protein
MGVCREGQGRPKAAARVGERHYAQSRFDRQRLDLSSARRASVTSSQAELVHLPAIPPKTVTVRKLLERLPTQPQKQATVEKAERMVSLGDSAQDARARAIGRMPGSLPGWECAAKGRDARKRRRGSERDTMRRAGSTVSAFPSLPSTSLNSPAAKEVRLFP